VEGALLFLDLAQRETFLPSAPSLDPLSLFMSRAYLLSGAMYCNYRNVTWCLSVCFRRHTFRRRMPVTLFSAFSD